MSGLLRALDLERFTFWLRQIGYHQGRPGLPNFLPFEQRLQVFPVAQVINDCWIGSTIE